MHTQATPNDFAAMSAESEFRPEIHVAPDEMGEPTPAPARFFPTWEDGMAFLLSIHEEIAPMRAVMLAKRGEA